MKTIEELGESLCDHCPLTLYGAVNTTQYNMCEGRSCEDAYEIYKEENEEIGEEPMKHKRVIFSKPATIVIWEDDSKTVVKCNKKDKFKKKAGYLMAYFQKHSGMTKHQCSKLLKDLNVDKND